MTGNITKNVASNMLPIVGWPRNGLWWMRRAIKLYFQTPEYVIILKLTDHLLFSTENRQVRQGY
jgi:hypothetical protein